VFQHIERLRNMVADRLEAEKVDALVVASPENVFYATGIYIVSHRWVPLRLVLPVFHRQAEPTHIICNMQEGFVRASNGWMKDVRVYVEFKTSPIRMLADVLKEKGLHYGRVWLEKEHLNAHYYDELKSYLPNVQFGDCSAFMDEVRMVKTEEEQALLAENARLLEQALVQTYAATKPGDTEKVIAGRAITNLAANGFDSIELLTLTSGLTVHGNFKPGDTQLRPGDMLRIDAICVRDGYKADICRQAILGEPSPAQADAYRRFINAQNAMLEAVRIGAPACDIFAACRSAFEQAGLAMTMPHIGHGLGIGLHEHPMVSPLHKEPLVPGMVFNLEPIGVDPQAGGFCQELTLHMTEEGPVVLSDLVDLSGMFVMG